MKTDTKTNLEMTGAMLVPLIIFVALGLHPLFKSPPEITLCCLTAFLTIFATWIRSGGVHFEKKNIFGPAIRMCRQYPTVVAGVALVFWIFFALRGELTWISLIIAAFLHLLIRQGEPEI